MKIILDIEFSNTEYFRLSLWCSAFYSNSAQYKIKPYLSIFNIMRTLFCSLLVSLIALPAWAEVVVYSGTVISKVTGSGSSYSSPAGAYLVLDRETEELGGILFWRKSMLFGVAEAEPALFTSVLGSKGKETLVIQQNVETDAFYLQGPVRIQPGLTQIVPTVLKGMEFGTETGDSVQENFLLEVKQNFTLNATKTALSNANGDTVDAAVNRLAEEMRALKYSEIEDE